MEVFGQKLQLKTYPIAFPQHHSRKAVGTGSDETWRATDKALIHDGDFQEVFRQRPGLEVIIVRLADPP